MDHAALEIDQLAGADLHRGFVGEAHQAAAGQGVEILVAGGVAVRRGRVVDPEHPGAGRRVVGEAVIGHHGGGTLGQARRLGGHIEHRVIRLGSARLRAAHRRSSRDPLLCREDSGFRGRAQTGVRRGRGPDHAGGGVLSEGACGKHLGRHGRDRLPPLEGRAIGYANRRHSGAP